MRNLNAMLLAVPLSLALAVPALAGGDKDKKDNQAQPSGMTQQMDGVRSDELSARQRPDAPEGFILIEERLVYVLANEPHLHMTAALANLSKNDPKAAAEELRVAANYVEMQTARGDQDTDSQKISQSADKLRKVADKVEQGELTDASKLSKTFAKANLALAEHYNKLAKSYLEKDRFVAAGHELRSAATSLRQAVIWNDEQPDAGLVALVNNAERVSAELVTESVGREIGGEAQPAAAREEARDVESPITGTTEAEAQNISEHAQRVTSEIDQQIDQLRSKIGQDQDKDKDHSEQKD